MARRKVVLVLQEGVQALDVAGPLDVFAEANARLPVCEHYDCYLAGHHTAPMRASNGLLFSAHMAFEQASDMFHTVLVPGGPGLPESPEDRTISAWLRAVCGKATRYGSICTGAFMLGQAGLLDGRIVTTHWQHAEQLARLFPKADVQPDRIYVRDGRLVTSAGVTAGIDLALALVREDHGSAVALACAKRLVVVAQRQGGQSQFSPFLMSETAHESPLGRVQAYVAAHLTESFPVQRLATIAGLSVRSLARLFVKKLGCTPHDYVEAVRIDHARNLLEATDSAIKTVAFDCGFTSPAQMRAVFQKRLGLSPVQYRASFQYRP
ncbi:GlxA family transcriptional regulator [Acetobacteraceae bacterium B3987]|nr:GlxA family transcriptional regulator [Acetobacteraceae bacterium B3987]